MIGYCVRQLGDSSIRSTQDCSIIKIFPTGDGSIGDSAGCSLTTQQCEKRVGPSNIAVASEYSPSLDQSGRRHCMFLDLCNLFGTVLWSFLHQGRLPMSAAQDSVKGLLHIGTINCQ